MGTHSGSEAGDSREGYLVTPSKGGFRVARRIDVGMAFINNYFRGVIGTPFGGTKYSGYGREHAIETLREFTYTKMVRFPSGLGTIPSWRAVSDIFDDVA